MSPTTLVATANVLDALDRVDARAAVATVLAEEPDLVGLQEWGWWRRSLLPQTDYAWFTPLYGGNPVGARRDRFTFLGARVHLLAGFGWSDRGARSRSRAALAPSSGAGVWSHLSRQRKTGQEPGQRGWL